MAKKLDDYRKKRDFAKTNEPSGALNVPDGNRFVVHKHAASADHYDLRLQVGDVLKCWAVPKGPSLNPADKRLAVETEDHPAEYVEFEGVIPKGQYGAGPMIIWDAGTWAPMSDIAESLQRGQFKFRLVGEKLQGGWMLTRLKPRDGERQTNWLLFKEKDFAADEAVDILVDKPHSVISGRRIEDLVAKREAKEGKPRPGALTGAVRAPLPDRVKPQLASSADETPGGAGWLHEIKFDGYRTLARIDGSDIRLITRGGLNWTKRYGDLAPAFSGLNCRNALIDGEIVVLDGKGASSFIALQEALSAGSRNAFVFFAFDLLYLNGWDLRKVELSKRKDTLERLLAPLVDEHSAIQFSDHVDDRGADFFDRVTEMGLEGVVSKKSGAIYRSGRSQSWVKTKARRVGAFPILGYTLSKAAGGLAALAIGEWVDGKLVYRGKVGTGFDQASAARLVDRLERADSSDELPLDLPKGVIAVRPGLSALVHYATRTGSGALRHPVFKGLREIQLSSGEAAGPAKRLISDADLASVWVTNPDRRFFAANGPTKLQIATYYAAVGDYLLPHLLKRPVSLIRCPTGKMEDCFYQRHPFTGMPESITRFFAGKGKADQTEYIAIEDAKGYLPLAQFGAIEFHPWGSKLPKIDKPDRIIFDLDPGEGVAWREIVEAAVHLGDCLKHRGFVPFVKTSGGKGLHVVIPIAPTLSYKTVHERSGHLAAAIAASAPDVFVTKMAKSARKNRIFIDFHRNSFGATAVGAYSLRARENLPVSTPLSWNILQTVDGPADFNYATVPALLAASGDPWVGMDASARALPAP